MKEEQCIDINDVILLLSLVVPQSMAQYKRKTEKKRENMCKSKERSLGTFNKVNWPSLLRNQWLITKEKQKKKREKIC